MQLTQETIDMMILAAPLLVVALPVVALLLFLFRCFKSGFVLLAVAVFLNCWLEQIPVNLIRQDVPAKKEAGTLRIFEYNICAKAAYYQMHRQPEFVDYILGQDADILFLPENTAGVSVELEAALKNAYPYSVHSFREFETTSGAYADFTLYSRYPLSDYKNYKLDNDSLLREHPYLDSLAVKRLGDHFMAYEATADVNGSPVTLLHVHLRSNLYDDAKAEGEGKRQKVHNVYDRLLVGYAFRAAEARVIAEMLGNCPNPLIVCGDFNDFSGSRAVRAIQNCRRSNVHAEHRDRLNDAWWEGGFGFGFTFSDQHLRLRLDHILYSKEFQLQAVDVPKAPYSDHYPLVADFVFSREVEEEE